MTAGVWWEEEGVGAGDTEGGRGGIGGGSKDSGDESTLITSGWKHHNKNVSERSIFKFITFVNTILHTKLYLLR